MERGAVDSCRPQPSRRCPCRQRDGDGRSARREGHRAHRACTTPRGVLTFVLPPSSFLIPHSSFVNRPSMPYPQRIVCLTEETTETLYLLGEGDRVVGVSGYTVRPPEARQKPRISSFLHARFDKIEALEPDLILAFSDLQASITTELVSRGYPVFTFNQRSVPKILQMIRILGGIVGVADKAEALADGFEHGLERIRDVAAGWPVRPRV